MKHHINAGNCLATDVGIAEIARQELDRSVQRGEVGDASGAEIVNDAHRVTKCDELLSEMRADEPGATSDQAP